MSSSILSRTSLNQRKPLSSTLQFWEMAIPKADRSPLILILSVISNHAIQELM